MDKKISQFLSATTLLAVDLIPIVSASDNKVITAGMFASNLPSVGNKGITKNTVNAATSDLVDVSSTITQLTLATHTIPNGVDGQQIKLFSSIPSIVTFVQPVQFSQINFSANGFCTLRFINTLGWIVESNNNYVTYSLSVG